MHKEPLMFRTISDSDMDFLSRLYASTRQQEMMLSGWDQQKIDEFLLSQFEAQHQFYQMQFKDGKFDIVSVNDKDVGRLYLDYRDDEIRIIDIALLPEFRGTGIGSRLLSDVISQAEEKGIAVRIHVEKNNPALSLYNRLGFEQIEDQAVYFLMERVPVKRAVNG